MLRLTRRMALLAASVAATALVPLAGHAETVLRFSHTDSEQGSRQAAALAFAEKVAEYSNGRLKVEVFHSGQLGNDPKAIELVQLGALDFTVSATGSYAGLNANLNLTAMPFLFDTYEQGWAFYDTSEWLSAEFDKLEASGVHHLSTWEAGFRSFTTTMPLASPADAAGKKMRVFPNDMIRWIMESIGFSTVVMPVTEVYLALQQGTVDGQENPTDTIYSKRFYEVAPHVTLTRHVYSPLPMVMSQASWEKLSPEDQEAVTRAAADSATVSRTLVKEAEAKQLEEMAAKGAIIATPDLAPFKAAVAGAYEQARGVYGAEVDKVLAAAEAVRAAHPAP
jgi:tripartite ATP-independent transporter DctP family solute receptor